MVKKVSWAKVELRMTCACRDIKSLAACSKFSENTRYLDKHTIHRYQVVGSMQQVL